MAFEWVYNGYIQSCEGMLSMSESEKMNEIG